MKNSMNILCATDTKYVPYCGIMLTSLFENNKDENINVFVLTTELTGEAASELIDVALGYGQKLSVIEVDKNTFKNCPIGSGDHVSLATYFRLATAELLPRHIGRVLYLDCDLVVSASLSEFYHSELDGKLCGVIRDLIPNDPSVIDRLNISLENDQHYFNAGVLLIDLDLWRQQSILDKFIEYINLNKERLAFHDQDTLNGVLRNQVKYFPVRLNLQRGFLVQSIFDQQPDLYKEEIWKAIEKPVIIHYTGPHKPWMTYDKYPLNYIWKEYCRRSKWKNMPLQDCGTPIIMRIRQCINHIVWGLGIKKKFKTYIMEH